MSHRLRPLLLALLLPLAEVGGAAELEWVRVAGDGRSFALEPSGRPFVPWGFNYDHQEGSGRLIEDYWDDEWPVVEGDFAEMKRLGANVVRVHLQFGAFMQAAGKPKEEALEQLGRLLKLAEQTGLYLDLTGLGCYHKQDVPPWYDALDEQQRWEAQAAFWEAVAARCADSPAVFCYDLMNEPTVPGDKRRDDWLGGAFGGKHFVQFITRSAAGRPRHEVARQWISRLVAAVRRHDRRHLITVGMVPWSLKRPGLNSGFFPSEVAGELDFIAVHLYPETDKVGEALETLRGFADAGKPVVIEETFPLKCGPEQLEEFLDRSRMDAAGWIGFYWGRTPQEYRPAKSIRDAIVLGWLELFRRKGETMRASRPLADSVTCEGAYRHHLQGLCTDQRSALFWSFTTSLVKTDLTGKVLKNIPVENHHGDLCHHDGRLYVAVNLGKFNDPRGNADSWVYVYRADDLSLLSKHEASEVLHGAGGAAWHDGRLLVVGGLPPGVKENYLYEYDSQLKFVAKHVLDSGYTLMGIQTAAHSEGRWWFGCYGNKLLIADEKLRLLGKHDFDCGLGVVGVGGGLFLIGRGGGSAGRLTGKAVRARADDERGIVLTRTPAED